MFQLFQNLALSANRNMDVVLGTDDLDPKL